MTEEDLRKIMSQALQRLNNIDIQNQLIDEMPKIFVPDFAEERLAMGEVDEWPNAQGEFGRTPSNPILVNHSWGEVTYLSRLVTTDGQRMIFHRVGSIEGAIDTFELVSMDGRFFDVLFVDMYHRHCSKKAPKGYTLIDSLNGITGTSENNPNFPMGMPRALIMTAINLFGAPIVSSDAADFNFNEAAKLIDTVRHGNNLDGKILGKMTI